VTDESPELVDGWVRKYKPAYPIVILKNPEFEDSLGVKFFPTAAVIGPDGNLDYAGSAGAKSSPVSKALKRTKGTYWPKSLGKARKAWWEGEFGKSYAAVASVVEKGKLKGAEAERVEALLEWMKEYANGKVAEASQLAADGWVYRAMVTLSDIADSKVELPCQEECQKLLDELEARPDFKREMKAGEAFEEAAYLEKTNPRKAIEEFQSVAKKYKGLQIAEHAAVRAAKLANSPGMR